MDEFSFETRQVTSMVEEALGCGPLSFTGVSEGKAAAYRTCAPPKHVYEVIYSTVYNLLQSGVEIERCPYEGFVGDVPAFFVAPHQVGFIVTKQSSANELRPAIYKLIPVSFGETYSTGCGSRMTVKHHKVSDFLESIEKINQRLSEVKWMNEGRNTILTLPASRLLEEPGSYVISDTEIHVGDLVFNYSHAIDGWVERGSNIEGITKEMIRVIQINDDPNDRPISYIDMGDMADETIDRVNGLVKSVARFGK